MLFYTNSFYSSTYLYYQCQTEYLYTLCRNGYIPTDPQLPSHKLKYLRFKSKPPIPSSLVLNQTANPFSISYAAIICELITLGLNVDKEERGIIQQREDMVCTRFLLIVNDLESLKNLDIPNRSVLDKILESYSL